MCFQGPGGVNLVPTAQQGVQVILRRRAGIIGANINRWVFVCPTSEEVWHPGRWGLVSLTSEEVGHPGALQLSISPILHLAPVGRIQIVIGT